MKMHILRMQVSKIKPEIRFKIFNVWTKYEKTIKEFQYHMENQIKDWLISRSMS